MLVHYLDVLPFLMATGIVLLGPTRLAKKSHLKFIIIITTIIFMVAQSSWFSSYLSGDEWGRDFANLIWFLFNTLTLGIFSWVLWTSE